MLVQGTQPPLAKYASVRLPGPLKRALSFNDDVAPTTPSSKTESQNVVPPTSHHTSTAVRSEGGEEQQHVIMEGQRREEHFRTRVGSSSLEFAKASPHGNSLTPEDVLEASLLRPAHVDAEGPSFVGMSDAREFTSTPTTGAKWRASELHGEHVGNSHGGTPRHVGASLQDVSVRMPPEPDGSPPSPTQQFCCCGQLKRAIRLSENMSDEVEAPDTASSWVRKRRVRLSSLAGMLSPREVWQFALDWIRQPQNIALFIWGILVGVAGAILFLVIIGALNPHLSRRARQIWLEVCSQVLNALFTFLCLVLHPQRVLSAFRLYRWNRDDVVKMRKLYSKDGKRKPREWLHMLVVVTLLNLNCLFQYCLAAVNWGYDYRTRPALGVAICFIGAFGCAAAAGVYGAVSPLGKDFSVEEVDEPQDLKPLPANGSFRDADGRLVTTFGHKNKRRIAYHRRSMSFAPRDSYTIIAEPKWVGGLFNCFKDPQVCILTATCFFCVFGRNMHALHFGNGYAQTATFLIFFFAPYLLFVVAAVSLHSWSAQVAVAAIGVFCSWLGLLYGAYWHVQMRQRFNLPEHQSCGRQCPRTLDMLFWLFFPCCSLCQEVRTAKAYDILEDGFGERSLPRDTFAVDPFPNGEFSMSSPIEERRERSFGGPEDITVVHMGLEAQEASMEPPRMPVII